MIRIGAIFPQTEIGTDPGAIREYAQAVEGLGYHHLLIYDHLLGASVAQRPNWRGACTSDTPFHEPFVLFGYVAAVTHQLDLVTGVLILPQRQTALVAKQAAEVDLLSGRRLRLGVGVGWNAVEYEALNEDFRTRGARGEEQIAVLRALWSQSVVTFAGRWHQINEVGINPLPIQRPIPVWIGGESDVVLRRIGRLGNGWFPQMLPTPDAQEMIERLHTYTREAGRAPHEIGIEARLNISRTSENEWTSYVQAWRDLGATHLSVNTMGAQLDSPHAHMAMLRRVAVVLGL